MDKVYIMETTEENKSLECVGAVVKSLAEKHDCTRQYVSKVMTGRAKLNTVERTKANGFDTLPDFLQLKSIEKLGMKLLNMQMALRHLKKTVTVPMDEAQAATVYYELTDNALKLGAYERNIACKIITQMELQYHNEKALKMSVMKPINLLIK